MKKIISLFALLFLVVNLHAAAPKIWTCVGVTNTVTIRRVPPPWHGRPKWVVICGRGYYFQTYKGAVKFAEELCAK